MLSVQLIVSIEIIEVFNNLFHTNYPSLVFIVLYRAAHIWLIELSGSIAADTIVWITWELWFLLSTFLISVHIEFLAFHIFFWANSLLVPHHCTHHSFSFIVLSRCGEFLLPYFHLVSVELTKFSSVLWSLEPLNCTFQNLQ